MALRVRLLTTAVPAVLLTVVVAADHAFSAPAEAQDSGAFSSRALSRRIRTRAASSNDASSAT